MSLNNECKTKEHCVKCVQIRSFFWSVFSRVRTEYVEIRSMSSYSVRMRENSNQKSSIFGHFSRNGEPLEYLASQKVSLIIAKKGGVNTKSDRLEDCNTNISSNNCRKGLKNNQELGPNKLICKVTLSLHMIYFIQCSVPSDIDDVETIVKNTLNSICQVEENTEKDKPAI